MTAGAMREVTWVKPELVAQVRFTEWTDDGLLRHPVFLGLRHDKSAKDVVRESPAPTKRG
jgi:bifunctional non-homologous end joining protein LigD